MTKLVREDQIVNITDVTLPACEYCLIEKVERNCSEKPLGNIFYYN